MTQIDCSDCQFSLEIGDGVLRSLISYFRAWIKSYLKETGVDDGTTGLIKPEDIEEFAWELSRDYITTIQGLMQDTLPDAMMLTTPEGQMPNPVATLESYVNDALEDFIDQITKRKAADPLERQLSTWALWLDEIAETPIVILGAGGEPRPDLTE